MVLLSHLQSSGAEIRGIWILPFCVGDRARASNWCTTPLAILCLTKHWHPGLGMTQNFLSFLSWNRNWNGFSRMTWSRTQNRIHVLCIVSTVPKWPKSTQDGHLLIHFHRFFPSSLWEGPEVWWVGPPVGIGGFPRRFRAMELRK